MKHVKAAFQRTRSQSESTLVLERSLARRYLIETDFHTRQLLYYSLCVAFPCHMSMSKFLTDIQVQENINHPRLRMKRLTTISDSRHKLGRKVGLLMEKGYKPLKRPYTNRVDVAGVEMMLNWLDDRCICGWAAGIVRDRIVSGETISLPRLLRDGTVTDLWMSWKSDVRGGKSAAFQSIKVGKRPGYGTFCFICEILTVEVTSSNCLSYYFTKNEESFQLYRELAGLTMEIGKRSLERMATALPDRDRANETAYSEATKEMAVMNLELARLQAESDEVLKFSKYGFPGHVEVAEHLYRHEAYKSVREPARGQ